MSDSYHALGKGIRISPRKARLVCGLVRGRPAQAALDTLKLTQKKAAPIISKLIQSALANATNKATVDVDRLVVTQIQVGEGPTLKRFMPRAQGRATPIRKRTSHIKVELKEI